MKVVEIPVDEIVPYWNNPRKNDLTVERLVENIKKFGFQVPLVLNKDKVVITGHARLKAAKKLGMTTVPCNIVNLSDEEAKKFRISDNKIAELSDWEKNALEKELREIGDRMELLEMGFNLDEINSVIGTQEEFLEAMEEQTEYVMAEAEPITDSDTFEIPERPQAPSQPKPSMIDEPKYTAEELQKKLEEREAELELKFAKESYEQNKHDNLIRCPFCGQDFRVRGLK